MYHTTKVCQQCGSSFEVLKREVRKGRGRLCSRPCIQAWRWRMHHEDPSAWFWKRVDKSGGPDACWPWLGRRLPGGYGRLKFDGKYMSAHRFALALVTSEPSSTEVFACHSCDNPPCCNPKHLWWGTTQENNADKVAKGRHKGAARKFDHAAALEAWLGGETYTQIAAREAVHIGSISRSLKAALRARQQKDTVV